MKEATLITMVRRIDRFSLMLLATVVVATLLPCRGVAAQVFALVTAIAIAALFFLHGAKLSRSAIIQGMTNWRLHLLVLATTFCLFPALGLVTRELSAPILTPSLATGLLFLTLLPSTVQSSIAFTSIARGNVPAAVCSASASNLLGIGLTPLLVAALVGGQASVSGDAVWTIVFQLLVPFVAGHLSRPLTARIIERHKSMLSVVDRGSILLVVYTAFSAAVVEGLWTRLPAWQLVVVGLFCIVLLVVVMVTTYWLARRLGFARADQIAILFCGSKKSLASGVPMAGVLFPAAQVGPTILPLMIFHQLQLLVCAGLAHRFAERNLAATRERQS